MYWVEEVGVQVPDEEVQDVPIVKPDGIVITNEVELAESVFRRVNGVVIVNETLEAVSSAMFSSLLTATDVIVSAINDTEEEARIYILKRADVCDWKAKLTVDSTS